MSESSSKNRVEARVLQQPVKADILQGDEWRGFQLFKFDTGERRSVQGLVMSNSWNVEPGNARDIPARVIFVPLVNLAACGSALRASGTEAKRVDEKLAVVRAQKTTNIFFSPAGEPLAEDHLYQRPF